MQKINFTGSIISCILRSLQVLLVLSGMRCYPSKRSHLVDMPGRGVITFLIIGNVSLWILRTGLAREMSPSVQARYYGTLAWLLLLNINLPLSLFFRFHSSVCLADIWHTAYTSPVPQRHRRSGTASSDSVIDSGGTGNDSNRNVATNAGVSTLMKCYSMPQLAVSSERQMKYQPAGARAAKGNGIVAAFTRPVTHMSTAVTAVTRFPVIEDVEIVDEEKDSA
jgi:Otopetrin